MPARGPCYEHGVQATFVSRPVTTRWSGALVLAVGAALTTVGCRDHARPTAELDRGSAGSTAGPRDAAVGGAVAGSDPMDPVDGGALTGAALAQVEPFAGAGSATKQVLEALDQKCTAHDLESCRNLAVLYSEGLGVTPDRTRAAELFGRACDGSNLAACNALALARAEGSGIPRDAASAVPLFEKACDGGYGLACRNLGLLLRDGRGIEADLGRAAKVLDRACSLGAPFACTNAGDLDASLAPKALDPATTYKAMVAHYTRGCAANEGTACRQVANAYLRGTGLPRSEAAAGVWLGKACAAMDAIACKAIGRPAPIGAAGQGSGGGSGSGTAADAESPSRR